MKLICQVIPYITFYSDKNLWNLWSNG